MAETTLREVWPIKEEAAVASSLEVAENCQTIEGKYREYSNKM